MQDLVDELHERFAPLDDGAPSDSLPELAGVDPDRFGISVVDADGERFEAGDVASGFSLQSASKPFVYGIALERCGAGRVRERVSVEPTGEPFNAIGKLDEEGRPFNALVNTGAIAVADFVHADGEDDLPARKALLEERLGRYFGRRPAVDEAVLGSAREREHRNRAIAHLLRDHDRLHDPVEDTLELYFHQCALVVSTQDLANAGLTLACGGRNPLTAVRALPVEHVPALLSLMLSCGMYDRSGEWAYEVGLPAKSGVGGGIVAVVPGRMGIGVFSPRIDFQGNSVRGMRVIEALSERLKLHTFAVRA
ncbi:glutaminase A [Phycisphaera mikurensis]|uniref:Glutaminase n=1 Tax=Phycisphaera mikurensis (strain NBRC 102666 / KCTC 22515 / FYK2301M01) TaxID=1142394 RepID=I0IBA1_PHYMF|nr:glutaminase A [Phycisphaera mikurensis]MBB6443034.1 glutaminase [Phycisphaera mikurensis]BAM02539.1 glutaminase [Phycisphaera mikurensis NBRC 102666]